MNVIYLGEKKICFSDHQNSFGIEDQIGNLLEHLSSLKGLFFKYRGEERYSALRNQLV